MSLLFLIGFLPGSCQLESERAAGKEGKVSDRVGGRVHSLVSQSAFQIKFSAWLFCLILIHKWTYSFISVLVLSCSLNWWNRLRCSYCQVPRYGRNIALPLRTSKVLIAKLTLILLTWKIWLAPNNANRWQMEFNSAFKGLSSAGGQSWRLSHLIWE